MSPGLAQPVVGQPAPDFELPVSADKTITLASLRGKNIVLYFYPKDSTPGCTRQAQCFRDHQKKLAKSDTVVIGVSRDSLRSHERFAEREALNFDLISDVDETACRLYDVIKEKNMYGKKVMGIERSTFLIDKLGVLRNEWRKVKVDTHMEDVLAAIKTLN